MKFRKRFNNSLFRPFRSAIVAVSLLLILTSASQAHDGEPRTLFVSPDGVDQGDCLTAESPCLTILYAINQANKGDEVVVMSGTYAFDPAETILLLSDMVSVRTGFEAGLELVSEEEDEPPVYIAGPSFEFREQLAARGFTLVQDPKGAAIEKRIAQGMPQSALASQAATPCVGGQAGVYPCQGVDFLARIALDEFSSSPTSVNDIWGFVDLNDNREYAIIGLRNGTAVVDVTDPLNPLEVGTIRGHETTWRDIKVYQVFNDDEDRWNAYAYVTADAVVQGLQVIDLTDLPTSIALAGTFHDFSSAHNVYMANTDYATGRALTGVTPYAYILGSDLNSGAFRILDLSTPDAPVEVTAPPRGTQYVHDATSLVISDTRTTMCSAGHNPCEIMVDYNENTVDLWDVTDKAVPHMISSKPYPNAQYTHSGWWSEDKQFLFIHDELDERDNRHNTRLLTLDISDLAAPVISNVWTGPTAAIDHNGFVQGDRYYMSNYRRGLTILDIADPNDPQEVAFFDTFPSPAANSAQFNGAWGTYPYLPSRTILVSDIEGGLFLLKEQVEEQPVGDFEYAAKFVCGIQEDPRDTRLARGGYATTINIYNPTDKEVSFTKTLALTIPPGGQQQGESIPFAEDVLPPHRALAVDCMDVRARAFSGTFPTPFIEGFVIIRSQASLDVVGVYTGANLNEAGAAVEHSSMDVEYVRERKRSMED